MHLTDHLTDLQLNEYLDNESTERTQIEAHLSSCDECTARLSALQTLFEEIESLPQLTLSRSLATSFTRTSSLPAKLPRAFALTLTLQAAVALIAIIFTVPIITRYLTSFLPTISIPSLNDVAVVVQMFFVMWMQSIQSFKLPTIPAAILTLPKEFSSTVLLVSLIGIFFIWVIGNWWLLRKQSNSLG